MYSLRLSPEQIAIRDTVREFVLREVKPRALAPDRLEAQQRPLLREVLDQAARLGLRTLALAEDRGGAGADTLTCCIVTEELAAGDPDVAAVLAQTSMLARDLFDLMTAEQRARFLPLFLADGRCHLALAEHEPDGDDTLGIDYHRDRPPAPGFKTTARRSDHAWIINGYKDCVANGPVARLFAVQVSTETGGASTLLVPRDAAGLSVEEVESGARWCHGASGAVTFTDCRVPIENLLGVEGHPLAVDAGRRTAQEQALNLGIGRAAYEAALDYAQLRVQGARRIIEHQAIGEKLAGIAIRLEIARAAIWQAAWSCDHPEAFADASLPDLPLASIAKAYASEAIYHATKDAAECFGAMGVMRDMPLQKYVHDALICLHSGAGNSEAKLRIAEALARYRRHSLPRLRGRVGVGA
jgi:alkylation response protein AidB-like acyl-CoA dehydrogenase